jgi:hypothetical protein
MNILMGDTVQKWSPEEPRECSARKNDLDITDVQEMRWGGKRASHNRLHQFITGFAVNKGVRHVVIDFRISVERMCVPRVKANVL